MSYINRNLSMRGVWHPGQLPDTIVALYRRAPASFMTFASLLVSYLANLAYLDYSLYRAIGAGGLGKPSIFKWLVHTLVLRPLSMSVRASRDADYLPPSDAEWDERLARAGGQSSLLSLPVRAKGRPEVFGLIPHRQIEDVEEEGSERQQEIINHLRDLASRYSSCLTLSLSALEATTSPSLFVTHSSSNVSVSKPTRLARLYLSGTPAPKKSLDGVDIARSNPDQHEVAHIHLSEGSLHLTLSPQDARRVVEQGWGELHRLAGLFYRGHYLPPYWLPSWLFNLLGGQSRLRWGYLANKAEGSKASMIAPTYCILYAPKDEEQTKWVKAIVDSSVAWAMGQPV